MNGSRQKQFTYTSRIEAPLEAVVEFYRQPGAFRRLSPPLLMQMQRNDGITEGGVTAFTLWLGPLPVRWEALHTQVDWPRAFSDTQTRGPFASWVHRHSFQRLNAAAVEIRDEIRLEFKPGLRGAAGRLVWLGLPLLFAFRRWATQRGVRELVGRRARGI
jgi:ligand-binding SRPBCC domain-containing protein